MNIVDEEKRIKHNKLATNIETVIQDGKKYLQPGMDKEQVRIFVFADLEGANKGAV